MFLFMASASFFSKASELSAALRVPRPEVFPQSKLPTVSTLSPPPREVGILRKKSDFAASV